MDNSANSILDQIISQSKLLSWMKEGLCYITVHGSHAYNTNVETSDWDYKGVCVPPLKYYIGSQFRFEQAELKSPDVVIFELRKFITMAGNANPNVIEVLFTDPADHLFVNEIGQTLLDNKEHFLSKRIRFSMGGYAHSQLKRIQLHRGYLFNKILFPPSRKEMGLPEQTLIPQDQMMAAEADIEKELNHYNFDFMEGLDDATKIAIKDIMTQMLAELKITAEDKWMSAARKVGLSDNFIEIIQKERAYKNLKSQYDKYQEWKKNRNPARAAMEEKFGFDCHVEETEFLTQNGWKKFDDVLPKDQLATVYLGDTKTRTHLGIEYQSYTEKFDGTFTGNLYHLYGNHIDVLTTPNHRMLIQKQERTSVKKYDWELLEAARLPDTFNIVRQIVPNTKNYSDDNVFDFSQMPIPIPAFLRLIGWYLSDGTILFNSNKADDVRVSQIKNGKLYSSMKKFANKYKGIIPCSLYEYERKANDTHNFSFIEAILSIRGELPDIIYHQCGSKKEKRIPRWVFSLSKWKMEILLDALIMGDGTKNRPDNGIIYYSTLKGLADDVQELAFLCGFETSLYGPYTSQKTIGDYEFESVMYQVHVNKTRENTKLVIRSSNIEVIKAQNKRIVCFTVPNGTLITRLNGHVGIHGNSKHGLHLIRLLRMCKEILETGKVIIKRPDKEELIAIRNGFWSYDELIEQAEKLNMEIDVLYKNCTILPHTPNSEYLDNLCINLIQKYIM